jgi:uncharacterized protein YjiS (DUF1127 family)
LISEINSIRFRYAKASGILSSQRIGQEVIMSLAIGSQQMRRRISASPARLWQAMRETLARARREARLRREIERLDDRMLSDLGLSRAQALFEVDRGL